MKKNIFSLMALLCLGAPAFSQGLFDTELSNVSKGYSNTELYSITPEQYNHHFEYKLPQDGTLKIDFLRLSDWGDQNDLTHIAQIAADLLSNLEDSFHNEYSSKFMGINIPIDGQVLAIDYRENNDKNNQLAYKNGQYFSLKTTYDTIRIVKNVRFKTKPLVDSGLAQIQYTFILKDIEDIVPLSKTNDIMARLGAITDSVIDKKRTVWKRQDATTHNLTLHIDATNDDSVKAFNNRGNFAYGRHIGLYIAFGATVYNSSVSPYAEVSIAYFIPTRGAMQGFVGLNCTGFGFAGLTNTETTTQGIFTSYNAEIGVCRKNKPLMPQKTSFLLGIMAIRDEKALFNFGFNFGINQYASMGVQMAGNFKDPDKGGRYVYGVNFKFNL